MKNNDGGEIILLSHGGGGELTRQLISGVFLTAFNNRALNSLDDGASVELSGTPLVFTTDSFVVRPLFFPGGDIGHLAVCGTVNDLAVSGAVPAFLSAGLIIEEGFPMEDLIKIVQSMAKTAREAGVTIVTGDTKVVEKGSADGLFINTSGIGLKKPELLSSDPLTEGDVIIINGPVGDHGFAVLSAREDLPVTSPIKSDAACLNGIIFSVLKAYPGQVKFMRDATRGGLSAVLNEMIEGKSVGVEVYEDAIPVNPEVNAICRLLGMDPCRAANEGKVVMAVKKETAPEILKQLQGHPLGTMSAIIGHVAKGGNKVVLKTKIGSSRIMEMPPGDDLPRIC